MSAEHELKVHPKLARKLADHITKDELGILRFDQVAPGMFVPSTGSRALLVILGAAPISRPAISALRSCGHVSEYIGLQNPAGRPQFIGPGHNYRDEDWNALVVDSFARTRDVNCVMSIFEVMIAKTSLALANLASSSATLAEHIPFELEPVNNEPFQIDLARAYDKAAEELETALRLMTWPGE